MAGKANRRERGARGSIKAQHSHHTVNYIVGKFEVAVSVGDSTVFQKADWGSALPRWVAARGWGFWGWGWGWGRGRRRRHRKQRWWGGRGVRRRRRRRDEKGRRRLSGRSFLCGCRWRRGRRRRRGLGDHGRRCGARARARPLSDEVRQRRQREVGRVVVVVSLDRAKVSSSTFGESP